jgi:hypothetical protein
LNAGSEKLKKMMAGAVEDVLPEKWETAPRMFKMEQATWRPWFRRQEEDLLHEVEVVEEQALDVMAKRLADQKAALLAGDFMDDDADSKDKQERAKGHWGKIRMHVKTKWRMSKMLRKSRMKTLAVRSVVSGEPINDIIPKGKTKEDDLSSFKYYALQVNSEHAIVTVNVTSSQGDPDLYVSNHILPSTVDYTWKVNAIGKCRLVIFPSDPNFIVGNYMIGVYSHVPARYVLSVDVSGGAYSSESIRNVERLTSKFNTVAEGFIVSNMKRNQKKPTTKAHTKKIALTSKEKAEVYAAEEADSELRLSVIREEVAKKVEKISSKRLRSIAKLEQIMKRSTKQRGLLAEQYVIEDKHASDEDELSSSADDEEDEDDEEEEEEEEEEEKRRLEAQAAAAATATAGGSSRKKNQTSLPERQSIAEMLKALEAAESGSSSDDDEDEENEVIVASAELQKASPDPISLWRPNMKLTKPTRHGFEAKNTFNSFPKDVKAEVQQYECDTFKKKTL